LKWTTREHDASEEDAEARGGHGEEVARDQVADVVSEERPPGLRGLRAALRHEAGDGALGDVDAELKYTDLRVEASLRLSVYDDPITSRRSTVIRSAAYDRRCTVQPRDRRAKPMGVLWTARRETSMLRLLLIAALGIGLSMLSAQADGEQPVRYPELCVEAACSHLAARDCTDTANLNRLLQACTANYNGDCVRVSCALIGTLNCNEVSELTAIARACSNNLDGNCVTAICGRLGSKDCDDFEEVASVVRQCGLANPYATPYR
jgi:hypothetical protein